MKVAVRDALRADGAVTDLIPPGQIFAVERATLPSLPAIELIAVNSERTDRPLIRHELSVEITVSDTVEDSADELLDRVVTAVRGRLSAAESGESPVILPDGSTALVELLGVRWSVSAGGPSSVIRGAAIALGTSEVDEVGGRD